MTEVLSPQINYKPHVKDTPRYYMKKVILNNNSTSEISIDTSALLEFKLPTTVWNLSRSKLNFKLEVPSSGHPNLSTYVPADCLSFIDSITLGDATGPQLAEINYVNRMTKVARKLDTKLDDYLTADESSLLSPSNDTKGNNKLNDNNASTVDYLESKYLHKGGVNVTTLNFSVPLSAISNSIFSMDKDLYFGSNQIYLKIQTANNKDQIAWVANSNNPSAITNHAEVPAVANVSPAYPAVAAGAGNPISVVNGLKLKDVVLYVAQESNDLINKNLMDAYLSGQLKYNLEWTRCWRVSSTNSSPNILISMNPQYGRKIKQILYTVFNGDINKKNSFYDNTNRAASKVKSFRSYLNTVPVQDDRIRNDLNEDYTIYNEKHCKNTVILNKSVYNSNFFNLDKFYTDVDSVDDSNNDSGYNLIAPTDYRIEMETVDTNLDHHVFITFSRVVHVNQGGLQTDVSSI